MIKIEFEGTDGAGKTTGLKYFIEQAKSKGLKVVETREVGNSYIKACVQLREVVLNPENQMCGEAMELIFAAMRIENQKMYDSISRIDDKHADTTLVVSDRGFYSHLAYTDHNCSPDFTEELYLGFMSGRADEPDYVVYFDVNTETALKRRVKRGDKPDAIEIKGIEFQEKVRESFKKYLDLDVEDGELNLYTVNANQDIAGVQKQLDEILNDIIRKESL